ncbi:photosynthetic complex putative assembly protein PuhB [Plastoroseomonas arctica]|uniref:PH domain-containing protein n=1 Tax=Plastoroseomonas arctica TaxID=1509237 RepID=A0AAF1JVA6_9PROT|nr:photosynthetic complex putative assembly protein PuhB [Plastoroseomonas arctica]MBR0654481.1 PH domain-containing protein [Plastoroseomonas arctica]
MREHEYEPTPGLPEKLPRGETLLWQGAPEKAGLARNAFHLRGLAIYFGSIILIRIGFDLSEGQELVVTLAGALQLLATALATILVLAVIGRFAAKSSVYTITDRRLVLRIGMALPMTINIPFASIATMALRNNSDGTGDIVLSLLPGHRVAWLALWPHCRTLKLSRPQPVLRALQNAPVAAQVLARALAASADQPVPGILTTGRPTAPDTTSPAVA